MWYLKLKNKMSQRHLNLSIRFFIFGEEAKRDAFWLNSLLRFKHQNLIEKSKKI
jgi:hypothetical protein